MRYQALVFDLDDTLYLERDYVLSGFRAVAAWVEGHLGFPQDEGFARLQQLFEQGVRGDTFNQWLKMIGMSNEKIIMQLVTVYREHQPTIAPFPETFALLNELRAAYRLGLLSDGYLQVQEHKLVALNLGRFFDVVVFSDTWGRAAWKPSQKPFRAVLEHLGNITPSKSIYVADNPTKDFYAPCQLGMRSVRVRHPEGLHYTVEPHAPEYMPDITVESVKELEQALAWLEVHEHPPATGILGMLSPVNACPRDIGGSA